MKHQESGNEEDYRAIEKAAEGACRHDEALKVVNWIMDPSYRIPIQKSLERLWYRDLDTKGDHAEAVDLQPTLDKIHHRINIHMEQADPGLQKRIQINRIFLRVAAVLFLPLLISTMLYVYEKAGISSMKDQLTELTVTYGSKLNTVLPDGTTVWLNSGSTLEYPQSTFQKNRSVRLTGEAYFDVTPNKRNPFIVETETINIKVIGTRFNVRAYPEDKTISATLEEGRVAIETGGKKGSSLCLLEPRERIVFQKENRTFQKHTVQTDMFTSWKDGKLIFRNNSLDYIIKQLERWFNTEIEISNGADLSQTPFNMTIENETIEQVLKYLTEASGPDITYEVIPEQKREDGKISRRKYIIVK